MPPITVYVHRLVQKSPIKNQSETALSTPQRRQCSPVRARKIRNRCRACANGIQRQQTQAISFPATKRWLRGNNLDSRSQQTNVWFDLGACLCANERKFASVQTNSSQLRVRADACPLADGFLWSTGVLLGRLIASSRAALIQRSNSHSEATPNIHRWSSFRARRNGTQSRSS